MYIVHHIVNSFYRLSQKMTLFKADFYLIVIFNTPIVDNFLHATITANKIRSCNKSICPCLAV